jgi:ABC-type proline/glycine betaine transport system permease subunit
MKKISKLVTVSALGASLAAPLLAFAAGIDKTEVQDYADSIIDIINNALVPALMAVAFIVFLFGVYKYFIASAEKDTEREEGRKYVLWGVIGFVIILSVWGLVAIVRNTLNLSTSSNPPPPIFNTSSGGGNWF